MVGVLKKKMRKILLKIVASLIMIAGISLSGCQQINANNPQTEGVKPEITNPTVRIAREMKLPRLEGKATVVMKVNGRSITIEVDGYNAPITAGNFVDLVQKGVYNGTVFHRVVKEPQPFVVQGGDPQSANSNIPVSRLGTGSYIDPQTGQPRYIPLEIRPEYDETQENATPPDIIYSRIVDEPPELKHKYGVIAMARSQMPDSASAQFYFTLAELPFLDGKYAVFGRVVDGMDVVESIKQGDRIESAEVIAGAENLKR